MGLFDKKSCGICGKEIGLLGGRKVDDGHICKDCASKLSPFFSDRRRSTIADIKKQLDYRAQNQIAVNAFAPTKTIGKRWRVLVEETSRRFVVTASSNFKSSNPDVINIAKVYNLEINIDEDRNELYYEDKDGNDVSYDPPRYEYKYRFLVKIQLNHDYFDEINFELTDERPDAVDSDLFRQYVAMADDLSMTLTGKHFEPSYSNLTYVAPSDPNADTTETAEPVKEGEWFCPSCGTKNSNNFCAKCGTARPVINTVSYCPKCGNKITDAGTLFCPKCGNKLA